MLVARSNTYTAYNLTCCTKADIDRLWQPGTSVELHWMVESASVSKLNPTHRVSITANLSGPYSDQDSLKRAIQQEIENPLAKEILAGKFMAGDTIHVAEKNGAMVFDKR